MIDMSRMPMSDMFSVRGIGVALIVRTSTFFLSCLIFPCARRRSAVPRRRRGSPRSRNCTSFESRRCVPTMMSTLPAARSVITSFCSTFVRNRLTMSMRTGTEGGLSACSGSNETTPARMPQPCGPSDTPMTAASAGITQMDLHGALDACKGGPPMSPICDTGAFKKPTGVITEQANYYAMMMINAVQPEISANLTRPAARTCTATPSATKTAA